jgi:DNA-directed RNA polymerase subunit RPC12/RpoP
MAIELKCDRCGQELRLPDEWGGKRVRCKGCNRVLKVPDPLTESLGSSFDVEALASESGGAENELVTEFAPIPKITRSEARRAKEQTEKLEVKCPHCGKVIEVKDKFSEILCSSCWQPVPPIQESTELRPKGGPHRPDAGWFYDEIMTVFSYPLGAASSILLSMVVAGGAILLPVGVMLMFVMGVALNPIADKANVSWVPFLLAGMFLVEAVYFAGMAYSALLDAARATVVSSEKPVELTWNPASVGSGIVAYVTIVIVYGVVFLGVNYVQSSGEVVIPTSLEQVRQLMSPVTIFALVLLTFTVPMAIIGLSISPGLEGLSPGRIIRSIIGTAAHYLFLFLVVCFVLGIYLGLMSSVVGWAIDALMAVLRQGIDEGLGTLVVGLLAWTILVGVGFYFALMMGRLHGMYARTFRRKLAFG